MGLICIDGCSLWVILPKNEQERHKHIKKNSKQRCM